MNPISILENPSPKIQRRLSQGQLNVLQTCPRKFQYTYLENLGSPVTPQQQEKMVWGNRFHTLMQQRELGLPVESLLAEDPLMYRCYRGLLAAAPDIFQADAISTSEVFREAEHCRTLSFSGYLLTGIYDLSIADRVKAQILDWKTYPRPKNSRIVEQNWQTRLYPFLFAETSDYLPERISMTYWFVQSVVEGDRQPISQSLTFTYNRAKHQQTWLDLEYLLNRLTEWLHRYETRGEPFPQVAASSGICESCPFATRCQRGEGSAETAIAIDWQPNLAEIQEVQL